VQKFTAACVATMVADQLIIDRTNGIAMIAHYYYDSDYDDDDNDNDDDDDDYCYSFD
jgi:hypothetical protein